MSSSPEFVAFVASQLEEAGTITYRMMFGEYGLYADKKFFALVCDDKLFIKPTESGRAYIGDVEEAPPYPGAKNYFLITDKIDDKDWLGELGRLTKEELPEPKPKKKKKR